MDGNIGEIRIFTGSFAPQDWAYCDGEETTVKTAVEARLYAILGNRFGGNPRNNTFALPTLADPMPGARYIICINGSTPIATDG